MTHASFSSLIGFVCFSYDRWWRGCRCTWNAPETLCQWGRPRSSLARSAFRPSGTTDCPSQWRSVYLSLSVREVFNMCQRHILCLLWMNYSFHSFCEHTFIHLLQSSIIVTLFVHQPYPSFQLHSLWHSLSISVCYCGFLWYFQWPWCSCKRCLALPACLPFCLLVGMSVLLSLSFSLTDTLLLSDHTDDKVNVKVNLSLSRLP